MVKPHSLGDTLKNTQKRQAILGILAGADRSLTVEEIFTSCMEQLPINLSTVYRTLAKLSEKALVARIVENDGKARYSLSCKTVGVHHYHLVCAKCKSIVELDDCPMETMQKKIGDKTGYIIIGHTMELTGLCPKCQ
jgi:Fur family transcriptional regulator, ferric uptake regulator